ncbi:MAG: hypothetical protein RBS57_21055, partial [Desulforhabdus sp.]|nr:hypothetical protein [Desulforhabdus sp.]
MIKVIKQHSKIALLILSASGLAIAALSGLSAHIDWLASLCTQGGSGCRETAGFAILRLPLWLWGGIFYLSMLLIILRAPSFTFLWAAAAFGLEFNLLRIMFAIDVIC